MNEKIGIGIIVGLMFASSMFVYNSDKFSKAQKTILLFFVLFPPLQWASILILLLIDYYKNQNSIPNVANRKVRTETTNYEDKISTLRELRNKQLLTEDEYNQKADILKNSIAETELKQSDDYRKLKSLFDDNILTKEEFEQKLEILSERPPIQRPISKVQETNNSYWRIIAGIIILFIGVFLLIKMYNTRNREITYNNNSDEIYMDSSAVDYEPVDTSAVITIAENESLLKSDLPLKYYVYCSVYFEFFDARTGANGFEPYITNEGNYCSQIIELNEKDIPKFNEKFRNQYAFSTYRDGYGTKIDRSTFKLKKFKNYEEALKDKEGNNCKIENEITIY